MQCIVNEKAIFYFLMRLGKQKIFLINLFLSDIQKDNSFGLKLPSSGTSTTLLLDERTAHSTLKLTLNLATSDAPIYNISKNSGQERVLKSFKVIIWNECTMGYKKTLEGLGSVYKRYYMDQ